MIISRNELEIYNQSIIKSKFDELEEKIKYLEKTLQKMKENKNGKK